MIRNYLNTVGNLVSNIVVVVMILASLIMAACSGDHDNSESGDADGQSTALSVDTGEGSFSFKQEAGGESTAVSIDADEKGK